MVENSNTSYENEIHKVDDPSSEDSKCIFFGQRGLNLGRGRIGKFSKNGLNQGNLLLCKLGVLNSNREYWCLLHGTKSLHCFGFPKC